jgi:hypothetical protein
MDDKSSGYPSPPENWEENADSPSPSMSYVDHPDEMDWD